MKEKVEQVVDILYDKDVFGPIFWEWIQCICLCRYSDLNPANMNNLLDVFASYIVCETCRDHFKELRQEYPFNSEWFNKEFGAAEYINFIHNKVNERLGKETIDFEQWIDSILLR